MAIGNIAQAFVSVRARTDQVENDIRRGFNNSRNAAGRGGRSVGDAFARGFNNSSSGNIFKKIGDGFKNAEGPARKITEQFRSLIRINYTLSTALGVLVGGISSVLSGIVSLAGAAGGAASAFVVIGNGAFAMVAALSAARLALGGVGRALSALNRQTTGGGASAAADAKARENAAQRIEDAERSLAEVIQRNRDDLVNANNDVRDAQIELNKAFKEGREEIQQLGFDAEDAALSEKKAALELEKARETLARVQDLPPNSRARKEAELAFQEADLALRKAKDRNADLTKEQDRLARTGVAGTKAVVSANQKLAQAQASKDKVVRDGIQSQIKAEQDLARAKADAVTAGDSGGGTDPFAGLNQFQIDFVKFLASLKPKLDELKLSISEAFLPPLQTAISTLVNGAFPTIKTGLTQVGAALGSAAISIANAMVTTKNLENLSVLFKSSATIIEGLGRTIGSVWGAATGLLVAASPLTERYARYLEGVTSKFDGWVNSVAGQSALRDFFDRAGNAAADFGTIAGNILGGFGKIINANLGPGTGGQVLLDWLKEATQKFQDMDSTFEGAGGMREFFRAVAYNTKSIMQSIGALLGELIKLGANQSIGITFGILEKGAPFIGQMMNDAVDAGPAMANLVVVLAEIGALLSDPNQASAFFDGIRWAAEKFRDFLKLEVVQEVLKIAGPITAFAAGLGVVAQVMAFAGNLILGYLTKIAGAFMAVGKVLMANPILIVIGALVAAFVYLYTTSEEFKTQMDAIFGELATMFGQVFGEIATAVMDLVAVLGPVLGAVLTSMAPVISGLVQAIASVLMTVMPILSGVIVDVVNAISSILVALTPVIPPLMAAIGQIIQALLPLIPVLIDGILPVFVALSSAFLDLAVMLVESLAPAIGPILELFAMIVEAIMPIVIVIIEKLLPVFLSIITMVTQLILGMMPFVQFILGILIPVIAWLAELFTAFIMLIVGKNEEGMAKINELYSAFTKWWNDMWAAIGQFLADTWNNILKWIQDAWNNISKFVTDGVNGFMEWWNGIWSGIGEFISTTWNKILMYVKYYWAVLNMYISVAIRIFMDWWTGIWSGIGSFIGDVWNNILNFFKNGWNFVVNWITGAINNFRNNWTSVWTGIGNVVGDIFQNIVNGVKAPINWIIDMINGIIGSINQLRIQIPDWVPLVGGKTLSFNIPKIPKLAMGGIVSPTNGGTLAQIAEAGRPERVEPLDSNGMSKRDKYMMDLIRNGSGTINITVNPSAGMDESELARAISREITFQMRRGAVA